MAKIDPKRLEGLKYHDSEKKIVKKDGKDTIIWIPKERPLTPDDVLSVAERPQGTVIVTADGQKITLKK